ncbi:SCAN domain-containing protein 3-like [Mercenaria mercenaria]|uniref:SCAN domain-containing protein 3-like n=1 Tax=Mercenaria mercenaria TaxID=6596 RepID=UPI00234EC78F|nr:SCAN domain-containing protein 3-like [Mercenaria mercenaria]
MEDQSPDTFRLTVKKRKPVTKDPNPEWFWAEFDLITTVAEKKSSNPKWGPKKLSELTDCNERKIKQILEKYFYDKDENKLYRKSQDNTESHRQCVRKPQLISLLQKNHEIDHRKPDAVYESLRRHIFPVQREHVKTIFKTEIKCHQCNCAADLPKTTRSRRPIPATYPNSRWQIDLKKMPACRGYNYVLNIVDCYSRFGFGKALKSKTSKEVAEAVISFIYMYGAPRIVQSDNGREFKNSDLADVVMEFEAIQMHGRPYHPQSQGRVERFNRTMTDYFRHKMVDERNWVSQLPEFYYSYNNRIHRSTRPSTPYQKFFKRPNFAAPVDDKVPYASLTAEEKEFLKTAHLDVEGDTEDIHHDDVVDNVFVATKALSGNFKI